MVFRGTIAVSLIVACVFAARGGVLWWTAGTPESVVARAQSGCVECDQLAKLSRAVSALNRREELRTAAKVYLGLALLTPFAFLGLAYLSRWVFTGRLKSTWGAQPSGGEQPPAVKPAPSSTER